MSNINLRVKHIFIHIPKTGGKSMCSVDWNRTNVYHYFGHYTIRDIKEFGIADLSRYFKWCFVRNPWDRLVSAYDYSELLKSQFSTFETLVNKIYEHKEAYSAKNHQWGQIKNGIPGLTRNTPEIFLHSQTSMITIDNKICMDFIGRYENLQPDWVYVCNKVKELGFKGGFNEKDYTLSRQNDRNKIAGVAYKDKPFQEYYTDEMKQKVEEIYRDDIMNFNYKFDNS